MPTFSHLSRVSFLLLPLLLHIDALDSALTTFSFFLFFSASLNTTLLLYYSTTLLSAVSRPQLPSLQLRLHLRHPPSLHSASSASIDIVHRHHGSVFGHCLLPVSCRSLLCLDVSTQQAQYLHLLQHPSGPLIGSLYALHSSHTLFSVIRFVSEMQSASLLFGFANHRQSLSINY